MSTYVPPINGIPLALAGVTLPDDGDDPDAASVGVAFEDLVDAGRHLQVILDPSTGRAAGYEPITRMLGEPIPGTGATYTIATSPDGYPRPAIVAALAFKFGYLLDLPHGSVLKGIRVYVYRPGTTNVSVWRRDYNSTSGPGGDVDELPVATQIGATATAHVAMLGDTKYVEVTMTHTIDRDDAADYFVLVEGAGADPDTHYLPKVRAEYQLKTIDQGAA